MFNWLYWIFGKILFGIDWAIFHAFGIHNIGLCVIFFTIIVYLLMYPLNSKQQKSSRLMSKINPELQEIQKKYKNKRDQASQMKMNEETQALYAKYGISPFGGCLPLLISFPIMICLYRVIYSMGDYVEALKILQDELVIGNTLSVCRPIESLICVPNFSRKAGAIERFFFTIFCPAINKWLPIGIDFPFGGYLFYVCLGGAIAKCRIKKEL